MSVNKQGDEEKAALIEAEDAPVEEKKEAPKNQKALIISFVLMIVVGLGNKILQKLMTLPMQNYPYYLSLFTTFVYIPVSFAYIWPMILFGSQITPDQRTIPQYKWMIMGGLDGLAGIMQTFAVTKLVSGSLIILLMQSAIPISMLISKFMLKAIYKLNHYVGSSIVVVGLLVVLLPQFILGQAGQPWQELLEWALVLIFSCVPMTLSSVYKEKALGDQEIDVVYLNGYVAVYQFIISIPLGIPAAYAMGLTIQEIPKNIAQGFLCYIGQNSQLGDECGTSPVFVNVYIAFNIAYNILIIMILKYGSSNLLWLAMTIMVPLGNVAFALPFVPGNRPLSPADIVGLVVIMVGLIIYRFWGPLWAQLRPRLLPILGIKPTPEGESLLDKQDQE